MNLENSCRLHFSCRAFRRLRNAWITLVVTALIATAIPAGSSLLAMELQDALRTAVENNPAMTEAQANLQAIEERRVQSIARGLPTYGISGSGEARYSGGGFGTGKNTALISRIGVDASQVIFDSGRTDQAVEQNQHDIQSAQFLLAATEQRVLLEAAEAYFDQLRAQELLLLAENNEALLNEELAAARSRLQVGIGTRTEVAQAETRLAAAESGVAQRISSQAVARSRFQRAVGIAPTDNLVVPGELPDLPASLGASIDTAMRGHPDLGAASAAERSARAMLEQAKLARSPTVSIFGTAYLSIDSGRQSGKQLREDLTAGVRLNVPLYAGGSMDSRAREVTQLILARQAAMVAAERRVRDGVVVAWERLVESRAEIRSGETRVLAAELAFTGVRERAVLGQGSTLDVLDAEQELQDARVALVRARYDEYIAAFRVRAAIGTLNAKDLGL